MLAINICSQKVSNHWFCVTMIHPNQLPLVRHLNPVVGPRKNLQRFGLAWTKFSNNTPSRPLASEMIPRGKDCLRRKTLLRTMKLRRFQDDWRQGRTYYPNRYITLDSTGGREWKSEVRNSLPDAIFVFGILLCIFVCKFCQSLLPALKMTLDGWKHVSNKHLQSKSLQSLVLCHNDTS